MVETTTYLMGGGVLVIIAIAVTVFLVMKNKAAAKSEAEELRKKKKPTPADYVGDTLAAVGTGAHLTAIPVVTGALAAAVPSKAVTLYEHCNYGGWSKTFGVGDVPLVSEQGLDNDKVSSVRVPVGCKLTLYDEKGLAGKSITLTGDNSCLIKDGFNDMATSMKVTCS